MLPHADRLPDERSQVLRDGGRQPLSAEDAEDGLGCDVFDLGDAVGVAEDDACARSGSEERGSEGAREDGDASVSKNKNKKRHIKKPSAPNSTTCRVPTTKNIPICDGEVPFLANLTI
jgi:hypothetical protein